MRLFPEEKIVDLDVDVRAESGLFIIKAKGEIDVWTADILRQSLRDVQSDGKPRVIVDLTEVPFVDSTGIGVLVGALKRSREAGGSLHLVVTSDGVRKVLKITSLDQVFPIHDSVVDAVEVANALNGSPQS
jgi:anti-sigma B factor antagonist